MSGNQKLKFDKDVKTILNITKTPKSIKEISQESGIPQATVYRRIALMTQNQLLKTAGYIEEGTRVFTYQNMNRYLSSKKTKLENILEIIDDYPGINYSELKQKSGLVNGTLSNCISNLEKNSRITIKRSNRRTWFFLPHINPNEFDCFISLRKETCKRILTFLLHHPDSTFSQIRNEAKKAPSTVSLTLTQLIELGLISRESGFKRTYRLTNNEQVLFALKKIKPDFTSELKDRFSDTFSYL
ncbi:MAG: hypothetical protein DWQ18_03440 [Crenarchaeota archaeon]|nr:MAG: hypothetical protein DWQ17_09690 [Thermoproteota archaeon]RDJ33968.1 MAG: hypothetical protein DWQ18_03440 [Thermoproteota archaeon]RDJ36917.1 MAG: hypothetical protein DWQ13_07175 [Thermoproteota archaeon]RDJ37548.1 MAG: hypothetical protein DWQ19_03660 [Thermoproteota archaeon]